jgi:AcrR family transcriptional regulator
MRLIMSPKTYRPSLQTRDRIIQTAIELFNKNGTAAVSLNSLADAAGMSAGNLQYHYRNREEIIRAILEVMFTDWNLVYQAMETDSFTTDTLRRTLELNFQLVWKYRFFYRELNALLRNDEYLAKRYAEIQEQRLTEQETLMKQMAGPGGGRTISKPQLRAMVITGWILSNSLLSFMESTGRAVDESAMGDAIEILYQYYKPYLEAVRS